jgi:octaprenyl-diphosphate synthase
MAFDLARIEDVFRWLAPDLARVERALETEMKSPVPLIPVVGKHITLSGGKRFRPASLLLVARALGYRGPRRITLSVVTEYMHTATLLHDDVVDQAVVRRGKASANAVYGNSVSVLVGDFLFARASRLMTDDGDLAVLGIYARTLQHLTEGEVLQLVKSKDPAITEEEYLRVVFHKTASLIAAATETGAVLAGAAPAVRRRMFEYGKSVGVAFQLVDDLLDYEGTEKELGKAPFTDLREGKVTLPLIHALRHASPADRERALAALRRDGGPSAREMAFVASLVRRSGGIDYTAEQARRHVARGKRLLSSLPPSEARAALETLTGYIVSRTR